MNRVNIFTHTERRVIAHTLVLFDFRARDNLEVIRNVINERLLLRSVPDFFPQNSRLYEIVYIERYSLGCSEEMLMITHQE